MRSALDANRPEEALLALDKEMELESPSELPKDMKSGNSLLVLDRSMILMQLGKYELSSRDLEESDKAIELLDFSRSTVDDVGKYMFSDATGPYKAPPYEKLMINTMNMVNYLVRGDLSGAKIEARRLAIMQQFLRDTESKAASLIGPGSYLAGFTFERSGNYQEALRYYDEALQYESYPSLYPAIRRLAALASYRTPRLEKALAGGAPEGSVEAEDVEAGEAELRDDERAELLLVINHGRVPALVANRVPLGDALLIGGLMLSGGQLSTARGLAAQSLVTWVNFPSMGKPHLAGGAPAFALDSANQPLGNGMNVVEAMTAAWKEAEPVIVSSAITRALTRAAVGVATSQSDNVWVKVAGLGAQAAMVVSDTPDTRSWSTLPARVSLTRLSLAPGKHKLRLAVAGVTRDVEVDLKPGSWQAVNLTVLR